LTNCDIDLIKTILECVRNTLSGNIPLTKREIGDLKKFKTILRKLLRTSCKLQKKRKIIIQNGGSFLPVLLKPIVAAAQYIEKNEAR